MSVLYLHLANNDIEKLKAFSYNTPEAEMLKKAIKNFK